MKASKNLKSFTFRALLVIAIILVVNVIAYQLFLRLDFTADKSYTLSKATRQILRSLDEPVTVTAYFTEDIPPQLLKIRNDFRDMLSEYASISRGRVVFEFIDPNKDQETEQKAAKEGVMPNIMNVRERDEMTQKRVFFGATLKMGNRKEVIPMIQAGASMEYELSTAIKKLTITVKPSVGFVQGHGEPSRAAMQQVMEALGMLHDVVEVRLSDLAADLGKFKTLIMVAPQDSIPAEDLARLDRFLASGGNLALAYNRVKGDFSTASGTTLNTGLEQWLASKGLQVDNSFIIDASCGSVSVQQQQGMMTFTTNVSFPYMPVIHAFADHPVTKGLEQVIMPFVSPINFTGNSDLKFTPLAYSSDKAGTMPPPLIFDINRRWADRDFTQKKMVVAGLLEGLITGGAYSRIILIADGDFAINGDGQRPQQLQPDNVNLLVNSVEWLSDQSGLIELRTKEVTSRPLDNVDEGKKTLLKWLNFLLPILLVVGYGIFRNQRNRRIRVKRMEEGYV